MAGRRRVSPAVQALFEQYTPEGVVARRLPRKDALRLMANEYGLSELRGQELLEHFDADQNGFMSLWEFQHFVNVIGNRDTCTQLTARFDSSGGGGPGVLCLTAAQVRSTLNQLTLPNGECFTDKEKDFFMKSSGADMGQFTFGQFADLIARIRLYKRPEKK